MSNKELKLLRLWESPPSNLRRPFLKSIAISGGLRGIDGLFVPFRYPITVLCGKNGVGKSTLLALAALAYHSTPDWQIPNWLYRPRGSNNSKSYYTFPDFFLSAEGERGFDGVTVKWDYWGAIPTAPVTFTKSANRWGRYASRPARESAFLTVGRMLPAHEVAGLRSAFSGNPLTGLPSPLPSAAMAQLSHIMGKPYQQAELHDTKRHTFPLVKTSSIYTGFNMGGGESWVIDLLRTLHSMPRASLLVIEEIEAGLHPEAQAKLMEVLVDVCLERHLQVICSTHSETIIDRAPRQARVLIRKNTSGHEAVESPSSRFALSEMLGENKPELVVYCEDQIARTLVEESLPHEVRSRCIVQEIGSKDTVMRQGVSHLRSIDRMDVICILDGDCEERDIERKIDKESSGIEEHRPKYVILPGNCAPEEWAIRQLQHSVYRDVFAEQFQCSIQEAASLIEAGLAEMNHHSIGFRISQRTSIEERDCIRRIMYSVAPRHPQLEDLREVIRRTLD